MKINIEQIIEGWSNEWFPKKKRKSLIVAVSKERMVICNECPHNSKFHKTWRRDIHCTVCLCTLRAKTKCLSCECPLSPPMWGSVLTEEEEARFKDGI